MLHRQTMPGEWLMADHRLGEELWRIAERLPAGTGILLLRELDRPAERRLRRLAAARKLVVVSEGRGMAARVHNMRELRQALLARTPLILLSPMFASRSHPDWKALPRMRAAALARLGGRRLVALGGMDAKRYARLARLGFSGWAGIDAFRT